MTIISSGATDIGRKRKTNQDSICLYPKRHFFAVADGMGGHNGGDIASQMAAKLLPEFIENNFEDKSEESELGKLLSESILHVNQSIFERGAEAEELKGMGTTISAILFEGSHINIANVGDSRTYMISKKKIYQMTRDHSLVQEKLNMGLYDREGAKADPQKNVLIRTVGFEPDIEVDLYHYKVSRNDLFLISSDGLHGKVSDEDILYIINKHVPEPGLATQESLDAAVAELIAQANANGGQDNISVILALAK